MMTETAANTDSKERGLLLEMWRLLKGEEKEEVHLDDVQLLIQVIIRLSDHKRIGSPEQYTEDIGFFNDKGQFCLKVEDIHKV